MAATPRAHPLPPFEDVVREHGRAVLRMCIALVGPDDADDAWSETFLSALRAYPALVVQTNAKDATTGAGAKKSEVNLEAWLITIARHRCIDLLRSRGRRPEPVDPTTVRELVDPASGLVRRDPIEDHTWALDLAAALATLSEQRRFAVVCHHLLGMPYALVAETLEISPAAARKAGSDGIAALRALVHPVDSAPGAISRGQ